MCKFSGFIDKCEEFDGKYSYYFDGEKLFLNKINNEEKSIHTIKTQRHMHCINTRLADGGTAAFFNCNYNYNNWLSSKEITIASAGCFISRYANMPVENFSGLVFSGHIVDKLFPPTQIVKYDSLNFEHIKDISKLKRDGSKTIVLKSFNEVDKSFNFKYNQKNCTIMFNISSPGTISAEDKTLGEIKSNFTITFEENIPLTELDKIYLVVRKLFQFLSNIKDISFDEIRVLNRTAENVYERIGNFYDLIHKENLNDYKIICPVKYYFTHIDKLFLTISQEKINFNYIPKNKSEIYTVSPEQYVSYCGALEYNYKKVFKCNPNEYEKILIDFENGFANNKIYSARERKFCKKIMGIIKNEIQSLESKYQHAYKKYKIALVDYIKYLSRFYNVANTPLKLNTSFSSRRNLDAHGELEPFSQDAICAYLVANAIIDCLILDKSGFTVDEIKNIINKRYMK